MRFFAIKDETLSADQVLGYLIYYENSKSFYIELPDGTDSWDTPMMLSSFAERGVYSIDRYWSRLWVQSRIVPRDRQNIVQILRDNGLAEYDEFSLLMLARGRCEQDDCFLEEAATPPEFLLSRWKTKVLDIVPLEVPRMLVFFRNRITKIVNLKDLETAAMTPHLVSQERFNAAELQPDGYGICWNERAAVSHRDLYTHGTAVPLQLEDMNRYVQTRVVSAAEACSILDCSRQNIDDLMRRGKLHPIRTDAKYKLFSKAEAMQRRKA